MSSIKRQNHRIHPCNTARKTDLALALIERYAPQSTLIVTSGDSEAIKAQIVAKNVTILSDEELGASPDVRCDLLINYDLPEKAILYMARFARAGEYALILLGEEDQKRLYPIELLNGRTITQEVIKGFEPDFGIAVENRQKAEAKARREERDALKEHNDQPRRDTRPERKHDGKPRFVGKDETGKPKFEGKTRERNHYIDGTPRTEEEKRNRTKFGSKPKFFGDKAKSTDERKPSDREKKPFGEKKGFGDKKPFGEKKGFDKDKKPYGEKKPYGDKKGYDKEGKKPFGDKKPYGEKVNGGARDTAKGHKKPYNDRKPSEAPASPKRPPRRIDVKSLKPKKESE